MQRSRVFCGGQHRLHRGWPLRLSGYTSCGPRSQILLKLPKGFRMLFCSCKNGAFVGAEKKYSEEKRHSREASVKSSTEEGMLDWNGT